MSARNSESGSVMILAMLVTLLILGIGLTAMWVSSSNMQVSGNLTRRQENLFVAETGLERARSVLATTASTWANLITSVNCGATKDDIGGKGKVLCEGGAMGRPLEDVPLVEGSALTGAGRSDMTYTIWIRNDDAEVSTNVAAGRPAELDLDRRVVARVEATGKAQLSYFAVEAVLAAPVVPIDVNYMGQHGGNAQGSNSGQGYIALP